MKDDFRVFVVENKERIVGFIVFRIENNYGILDNIVVAKESQKKGIDRALVEYFEGLAKSNNCKLMKTDTSENTDGAPWTAFGLWIRMGFENTDELLLTN